MRTPRLVTLLAFAVVAIAPALAACGQGEDPFAPDPTLAAATAAIELRLKDFANVVSLRRYEDAYAYLTSSCREQVTLDEFRALVDQLPQGFIALDSVTVGQLEDRLVPVRATYLLNGQVMEASQKGGRFLMIQEDGEWKFVECRNFGLRYGVEAESPAQMAEQDSSTDLPGQYYPPQGNDHLQPGEEYDGYNSDPPTSGPHSPQALEWKVYDDPQPPEKAVHNMEHGGVIIWHNCESAGCQSAVDQMRSVVEGYLDDGALLVMMPYPGLEQDHVAFTSWTRLDLFPASEYTEERLRSFIQAHERRYNPENF
jgi:hypothetical protein